MRLMRYSSVALCALALAGCGERIEVGRPAPPPERLVCEALPAKPDLAPLVAYTASNGALVYSKADVDARDAQIAKYVVLVRRAWFSCSSQLAWVRDYEAGAE